MATILYLPLAGARGKAVKSLKRPLHHPMNLSRTTNARPRDRCDLSKSLRDWCTWVGNFDTVMEDVGGGVLCGRSRWSSNSWWQSSAVIRMWSPVVTNPFPRALQEVQPTWNLITSIPVKLVPKRVALFRPRDSLYVRISPSPLAHALCFFVAPVNNSIPATVPRRADVAAKINSVKWPMVNS